MYVRDGPNPKYNFQVALNMTDTQFGFVSGTVFIITNSVSALILGYQVDKFNRKRLLLFSSFLWNLALGLLYFVQTYRQLIVVRMAFGVISSVHTPACISMIHDLF